MRPPPRIVTRELLYADVWQKPGRVLAAKYGISDVAIAKICRKLDVPRPPIGYWARVQHGQVLPKPPLPPRRSGTPPRAKIYGRYTSRLLKKAASASDF